MMLSNATDPHELFVRELAYGALTVFDIAILAVLANLLWWRRGHWSKSPSAQIAIALSIFVTGQLMRSSLFWLEYLYYSATEGKALSDPSLGTVGLTLAPLLVLLGASRLVWTLTAARWRPLLIVGIAFLAAAVPVIAHYWFASLTMAYLE